MSHHSDDKHISLLQTHTCPIILSTRIAFNSERQGYPSFRAARYAIMAAAHIALLQLPGRYSLECLPLFLGEKVLWIQAAIAE